MEEESTLQQQQQQQPQNALLVKQLIAEIEDNLANHLASNAVFLAERLLAEQDGEETRGILAECYMAESFLTENKYYKVYDVLKHCRSEMNRYRFALVCLKLHKYEDGERALLPENGLFSIELLGRRVGGDSVPNGCYGYYLLGLINEGKQKYTEAKECFLKALELNPTLWVAYEKICKISELEIIPYTVFCEKRYAQYIAGKKPKASSASFVSSSINQQAQQLLKQTKEPANDTDELSQIIKPRTLFHPSSSYLIQRKLRIYLFIVLPRRNRIFTHSSIFDQANKHLTRIGVKTEIGSRGTSAKRRKSSKLIDPSGSLFGQQLMSSQGQAGVFDSKLPPIQPSQSQQLSYSAVTQQFAQLVGSSNQTFQQQTGQQFNMGGTNQPSNLGVNSNSLFEGDYFGLKGNNNNNNIQIQQQSGNVFGQQNYQNGGYSNAFIGQSNRQELPDESSNSMNSNSENSNTAPIKDICTLLKRFGEAFYHMSLYLCKEAIELFNNLPKNHYNTGWVLTNIGRCYMEIVKYSEAEKYYAEALRIEPYRLEGIEYYSSCLWHLKKQVELCYLSQQALERSLFAPETWIAVGNCFSLQKEHENALKFFQRAIQLNPSSAYAHSLCGHEFVYNEDFAKARKSFQQALNFDLRNYNAWWGLGNIYYKQEKYSRAAEHFQKAITINQKNPVLYSFLGMSLAADRKYKKALEYFESSERLDPKNGLNKFQKANTLVKLENYDAALKELQELHLMMPKEAPIPMLIGKVYKKLKKVDMALKYFTDALDLENKDSQRIKALIESLHQESNDFVEDLDL